MKQQVQLAFVAPPLLRRPPRGRAAALSWELWASPFWVPCAHSRFTAQERACLRQCDVSGFWRETRGAWIPEVAAVLPGDPERRGGRTAGEGAPRGVRGLSGRQIETSGGSVCWAPGLGVPPARPPSPGPALGFPGPAGPAASHGRALRGGLGPGADPGRRRLRRVSPRRRARSLPGPGVPENSPPALRRARPRAALSRQASGSPS